MLFVILVVVAAVLGLLASAGVSHPRLGLFPLAFAVYMIALLVGRT